MIPRLQVHALLESPATVVEVLKGRCGMQDASAQPKPLQSARKGSSNALNALSTTPGELLPAHRALFFLYHAVIVLMLVCRRCKSICSSVYRCRKAWSDGARKREERGEWAQQQ